MVGAISEEKKKAEQSGMPITLKIKGLDENELFLGINRISPLKKLMDVFCNRLSVDRHTILFIFDGRILSGEKTPYELGLKNGDEIEAEQCGKCIALKIKYLDRREVLSRVYCSNPLEKLMNDFCDRRSVDRNAILFSFDGRVLSGDETPYELGLKNGDEIEAEQRGTRIALKIMDENNNKMLFRIGRDTPLKKYLNAFCDRVEVERDALVFLFDGNSFCGYKTPNELKMEDENQIDAMLLRYGG